MTLALADVALLVPLATFTVSDLSTRTIPWWLTLPALGLACLGWATGLWVWHPASAVLAFLAFRLASLPAGDQKGVATVAGFLPILPACLAVVIAFACGGALMFAGRRMRYETVNWPFFPWVAAAVLVVRLFS